MWTLVNFFLFFWQHTNKAFWKMVKAKVWKKISTYYSTKKLEREWWDLLRGGYIGCSWPLWCWLGTEPPYLSCWLLGSIAPHLGTELQKKNTFNFLKLIWDHSYVILYNILAYRQDVWPLWLSSQAKCIYYDFNKKISFCLMAFKQFCSSQNESCSQPQSINVP